jgi:ferredoxin, 2Fe-2S
VSWIEVEDAVGAVHRLDAVEGWRVMEIVRDHGLMDGTCGGACECATCHVEIDAHWAARLPPRSDDEEAALDTVPEVGARSRLACQILFSDALAGLRLKLVPLDA